MATFITFSLYIVNIVGFQNVWKQGLVKNVHLGGLQCDISIFTRGLQLKHTLFSRKGGGGVYKQVHYNM